MLQHSKKYIFVIILFLLITTITIIFLTRNKIRENNFSYTYLISNNTKNDKEKSFIILTDKEGNVLDKSSLNGSVYHNLLIDSSSRVTTIGDEDDLIRGYDYAYDQTNGMFLGKAESKEICNGRSDLMFETKYGNVYVLNKGFVNGIYTYYIRNQSNCFTLPLTLNQINYEKEKNQINVEGYSKDEYVHYQIDLNKNTMVKIKIENQDDYYPSIGSQYIQSFVKDNYNYTVIQYFDTNYDSKIFLIKRDNETYKILDQKLIEEKFENTNQEIDQNDNIMVYYENNLIYYLKYNNSRTFLEIYDLEFKLLETKQVTDNNIKLQSRLTKINNGLLHYVIQSNTGVTHNIYNINEGTTKSIKVKIDISSNQYLSSFNIKAEN